ncbi:hypothetical protein [Methylobacterium planeticum]|uniref:Uncharacterized protein n=1 Tax=Methylobacterium planeticum TaxID=2615211 RepID=A0A6N6MQY5_9HYPH|nr:hypothetical protein [Methylobacterium planeticum]KAB1072611.1 hypothetical protein F6X51_15075 [Methylobacterium planeticum]
MSRIIHHSLRPASRMPQKTTIAVMAIAGAWPTETWRRPRIEGPGIRLDTIHPAIQGPKVAPPG